MSLEQETGEAVQLAAYALVDAAPADWLEITYCMWVLPPEEGDDDGVPTPIETRAWVSAPGPEREVDDDAASDILVDRHLMLLEQGETSWRRCDLVISRRSADDLEPQVQAGFVYEDCPPPPWSAAADLD